MITVKPEEAQIIADAAAAVDLILRAIGQLREREAQLVSELSNARRDCETTIAVIARQNAIEAGKWKYDAREKAFVEE